MVVSRERIVKATISSISVNPRSPRFLVTTLTRPLLLLLYPHRDLTRFHGDRQQFRILQSRVDHLDGAGAASHRDKTQRDNRTRPRDPSRPRKSGHRECRVAGVVANVFL